MIFYGKFLGLCFDSKSFPRRQIQKVAGKRRERKIFLTDSPAATAGAMKRHFYFWLGKTHGV